MFSARSILITGGTGSLGRMFVRTLLKDHPSVGRIVIYSHDEMKQFNMSQEPMFKSPRLRFFIGDVRDKPRLSRAMEDVDVVIHAAALKHIPTVEYNPFEAIKTNVMGAQNVIECCLDHDIKRVIALSTDKAVAPTNLYGATKLCAEKLFVSANNYKGKRFLRLSVVRYGNVLESRSSVIQLFLKQRERGRLTITDTEMTRFLITLPQVIEMILFALQHAQGGEVFVPRLPSFRIMDLATAIAPHCDHEIIGFRHGEKLHEELITNMDSLNGIDFDRYFVILPSKGGWDIADYISKMGGKRCERGFHYSSDTNTQWLAVEELRRLIREYVDPTFSSVAPDHTDPDERATDN